ncbi:MAG: phosphoribosyl-AMP cyclohydrolase [Armatimonadetes bacterium CG_4_10_14_3_um_filter_66_18]|nr:phosphoribosyl-AMP cyclohydrolase [Armatimonadota bacterium]OIP08877.1 MAG: phosphoribosyl-AMP cyclohydrolase [Armatimonadetes bacterium CG2_30_66_41]PIU94524.1 MAG: phosphoribosyl-AMP cyclohydrolase [Armatimonadetes bacterium CG06_land_8_20_14_3_00_66_21]PIX44086.1 MAG: phosphoribosyl-AMP cyclohydrolase [Armatimonadetes bacterium CG_4_8_14_3_um_filter_66_20]PIY37941.1 MAG: phosphoribosyl-AMP cyclohydrolase [Armatimonadetes bacterium CG_4_10_14_3_um_filter_66_18]PIZ51041.1 MAG: phosphoribos
MNDLEEGTRLTLDFQKLQKTLASGCEVIPVVVQDADTKEVLVAAYANQRALARALETRTAVFWSTSRNELWEKGATSGDVFELLEVWVNCEQNSLLYLVRPKGKGMCHTKDAAGVTRTSCYYRRLTAEGSALEWVAP